MKAREFREYILNSDFIIESDIKVTFIFNTLKEKIRMECRKKGNDYGIDFRIPINTLNIKTAAEILCEIKEFYEERNCNEEFTGEIKYHL